MKILSIGNFSYGWDGSICDEEHIAKSLESLGHEVIRYQRDSPEIWTKDPYKPIDKIDFILVAQWDGYSSSISILKLALKCPLVYWAFDYQADGQEWHERLVKEADLYLSKRIADSKYPNWQWLSQDFAPMFLEPVEKPVEKTIDVLFTGSYLPWAKERNETLKAIDEKFNLTIHSVNPEAWLPLGFKNVQGPAMDDELPQLIAKAKINISIDHTLEAGYWSDRNAQIMCCGGYVLFRYIPLSESVFGPGVDYFYNTKNCLEKIQLALDNESHRDTVANIGYSTATWTNRLRVDGRVWDLINIVGSIL